METNITGSNDATLLAGDYIICQPRSYDEVMVISDYLKNAQSVIVNLEMIDEQTSTYLIHFLSGVIYGIDGEIHNLGLKTYLCTPSTIVVGGF